MLQGLLPHVVSLIQQGKEVPSGFSLLESYLLIGGPSVLAPVRGEIATVLQQTAERVLVAMSPRERTLHCGCALASVCSAPPQLKALLESCGMACCKHRLLRPFCGLLLSCCQHASCSNSTMQPCPSTLSRQCCLAPAVCYSTHILLLARFCVRWEHGN